MTRQAINIDAPFFADTGIGLGEENDKINANFEELYEAVAGSGGGIGASLLGEVVTSSSAADVTFSSVATIYSDLEIRVRGRGTTAAGWVEIGLQFNGDAGSNYRFAGFASNSQGQSSAAEYSSSATAYRAGYLPGANALSGAAGSLIAHIMNYRDTTWHKAIQSEGIHMTGTAATSYNQIKLGGVWISSAAITAVKVVPASGAFVDGTKVSLYGRL